jgi:HSP20 family molecular chaperone IbpA
MFASAFDVFDAFHSPLHRGYHRPAKRHRRAHHPYAAHLHPFYHIENLARIALDVGHGSDEDAFDPEVVETDRGYLITALVPGVAAGDISVTAAPAEAGEADRLLVRSATRPHIRADLRLPSGGLVDADNITASCIDGVFRVVVPKAEPALETVEIAAGDAPAEAPATPPGAAVFRLDVPGFAARDLRITVERRSRVVEISGVSETRGSFKKRLRFDKHLKDKNAIVSARCADGALALVVAPPAPPAPVAVPVFAEAPALPAPGPDAAALGEDEITVMRRAVPGLKAANFEVSATADAEGGARLTAAANDATRRVAYAATLPSRVDLGSLKAFVVDGVLTVTAAAPLPAERKTVLVRADAPAALPPSRREEQAGGSGEDARAPPPATATDAAAEPSGKEKKSSENVDVSAAQKDA